MIFISDQKYRSRDPNKISSAETLEETAQSVICVYYCDNPMNERLEFRTRKRNKSSSSSLPKLCSVEGKRQASTPIPAYTQYYTNKSTSKTNIQQVGHEPSALTTSRTLSSLYIEPLLSTLARLNPSTPFTQEGEQNGVFDTSSGQTLYLFIDLKTGSSETWPAVLAALEPLRRGNWLTTYDGKELFKRPVTVVGTGNTQYHDVLTYLPRDVFFDAPLSSLSSDEFQNITANEAPIASTNFAASFGEVRRREMNDTQLELLREQIGAAHERGVMARYWNQPAWPVGTRNAVWRTLWDEGVDLLNVDDLKGCSEFWEGGG